MASKAEQQETAVVDTSIGNSDVLVKYRTAADITDRALKTVIEACAADKLILELCKLGDSTIEASLKSVFSKAKVTKGLAFPTCLSVNNVICHFSPLPSDPEAALTLKTGDVVKIELGAQIDGYAVVTAHTLVIGATEAEPTTGRRADAIQAAYLASEAALRLLKPTNRNVDVTEAVQKITAAFDVKAVEGMTSSQQEHNAGEGKKQIVLNPNEQQRNYERCEFAVGDVWSVDILVSTGEAKPKEGTIRTTVYKKTAIKYQLKMKASRMVFTELSAKGGNYPFTLRTMEDEKRARMGIIECAKSGVVTPFPVFADKEDEFVAQFLFTALVTANGLVRLTPSHFNQALVKSDKQVTDESIVKLLAEGVTKKKNAAKKKAAAKKAAANSTVTAAE